MGVRHLVEEDDEPLPLDLVEARLGQGSGLEQNALMYGVGPQLAVEVAGVDEAWLFGGVMRGSAPVANSLRHCRRAAAHHAAE